MAGALEDLKAGFRMRRVWIALASEDIGDQHRRTMLGPLWLLVNYLMFAGTFIFLFRRGSGIPEYPAYVATGLLVWFFMMETIIKAVSLFVREEAFIKGTTLPLSVYVMRLALQSTIRAGYALVGCMVLLAFSGVSVSFGWAWTLIGIVVVLLATPAVIVIFAFLGAFFPDSQFFVNNLMRVGMFLTPVFWTHGNEGGVRRALYYWNPFTYFLDLVREPILTATFPVRSLAVCVPSPWRCGFWRCFCSADSGRNWCLSSSGLDPSQGCAPQIPSDGEAFVGQAD